MKSPVNLSNSRNLAFFNLNGMEPKLMSLLTSVLAISRENTVTDVKKRSGIPDVLSSTYTCCVGLTHWMLVNMYMTKF